MTLSEPGGPKNDSPASRLDFTPDAISAAAASLVAPVWDGTVDPAWTLAPQTAIGPMYTHRDDMLVGGGLRDRGDWDAEERAFIEEQVRPGMRVIDVGANIGCFTRVMADRVGPEGTIVAVEAVPATSVMLQANLALGGITNTTTLLVAAGRATGRVTMALPVASNLGSYWALGKGRDQVEMPMHRLDDLLAREARVDFIKIDVQGFDIDVVHGAMETIRRWRPTILLEVEVDVLIRRGLDPVAELESLTAAGLQVDIAPWMLQRLRDSRRGRAIPRKVLRTGIVAGNERDLAWHGRTTSLMLVISCPDPARTTAPRHE